MEQPAELMNLERRIELLEQTLNGAVGAADRQTNVVEELAKINQKLLQVCGDRGSVRDALNASAGIRKSCLQAPTLQTSSSSSVPDLVKLKLVDAEAQVIERACERLAHVDRLGKMLDSEHIRSAPTQAPSVAAAAAKQTALFDQVNSHTSEITELANEYNRLTAVLNRQFVFWDKQLTQIEQQQAKAAQT